MLAEAHPVAVDGLPAHLAAFAAVEQLPAADGGIRNRIDRRGQVRYDKVWVHSPGAAARRGGRERPGRARPALARQRRQPAPGPPRGSDWPGPPQPPGCSACCTSSTCPRHGTGSDALSGIAPRADAQPMLDRWLTSLIAQDGKLTQQLAEAVPAAAKAWAAEEAPRLINAAAGTAAYPGRSDCQPLRPCQALASRRRSPVRAS